MQTIAGTAACFVGGTCFGMCMLRYNFSKGLLSPPEQAARATLSTKEMLKGAALCSAVGAGVESLDFTDMDNLLVTAAVAATARAFFKF